MKGPFHNLRAMSGMSLGRECAFYYWCGWAAWLAAALALIYVEFTLRAPDHLSFYMVEAWLAALAPFLALFFADNLSLGSYQSVWFDLQRRDLGHRVIEREAVDRVRDELAGNLVLRWFRPPQSDDSRGQLLTVALWYRALTLPPAAPWLRRYGEWLVDIGLGYLPFGAGWALWMLAPSAAGFLAALGLSGMALLVLGYSAIRLAGRRQAVVDYFNSWLVARESETVGRQAPAARE